jgi:RNA polymerase sigma-70 factor (ECF subfamily)
MGGRGDAEYEAAYKRLHPPLYRYLLRLTGDRDLAEDLAQEAFVRLLEHDLPAAEIRPWIFAVATNLVRDAARTRQRRRRLLEKRGERPGGTAPPDEWVERAERIEAVRSALATLSERDREMLLLREEGFKYAEIAEVIGVAPGSVGTLVARALRRFAAAYAAAEKPKRSGTGGAGPATD